MSQSLTDRRTIADTLLRHRSEIARAVTDAFLERHPDWVDRYGPLARTRGEEDAEFHVAFLAGAVVADDPSGFEDYARWTARVLSTRGIAPDYLEENLKQVRDAAIERLDAGGREHVERMIRAGVAALRSEAEASGDPMEEGHEYRTERSLYFQAVRAGDRRAALNVALEAVRSGVTVPEVYSEIFQPVQYRIGQLWERNEITVAEEHMATAITQHVVGQLYSHLEIPDTVRGNALVTGVSGELHQLGANMVADVLEADGWNVRFLGTQLPHRGVLEAIRGHAPKLVGISAAVLSNLPAVADMVAAIRQEFGSDVVIVVGGAAFRASPGAWRAMGADGFGRDLHEAVAVANQLLPRQEA